MRPCSGDMCKDGCPCLGTKNCFHTDKSQDVAVECETFNINAVQCREAVPSEPDNLLGNLASILEADDPIGAALFAP